MKTDMNFTGVSDDDYNAVIKVLVKANKRRAKERVRERKAAAKSRRRAEWRSYHKALIGTLIYAAALLIITLVWRLFL